MIRIEDFDGDLTLDVSLSEHMQRRIFWMGYYNRDIVALLDRIIERNMTIIDAGANIGEITLVAAKRTGPAGRVIAFEPIEQLADRLQCHIDSNRLEHAIVVRTGLSDHEGRATIYDSGRAGSGGDENQGLAGLYRADAEARPLQQTELTTLDKWLDHHPQSRVDIIKIDIEGSELPCLKGARRALERFSPMLIVEVQRETAEAAGYRQEDILDYLAGFGYSFQCIGHGGKLGFLRKRELAEYQNVFCRPSSQRHDANR